MDNAPERHAHHPVRRAIWGNESRGGNRLVQVEPAARSSRIPLASTMKSRRPPRFCLLGTLLIVLGFGCYLIGVVLAVPAWAFGAPGLKAAAAALVWYSGMPVFLGLVFIVLDLYVFAPRKRAGREVAYAEPANRQLTVVLTAYNDEASIGQAVADFLAHPLTTRVVVVDNNSTDQTSAVARAAGAEVVVERQQGYGHCVFRALTEGIGYDDTELTLLCEGDMTFRAFDIDKLMAYIPHVDIVNGTRIVEQLRAEQTQLTTFMYYGNFAVGKLLELRHLGRGTFTDVGTTYKLCRNESLRRLLPHLNPAVNLEFNAHFLDTALEYGEPILECPVSFFPRVGRSKGGNVNDLRALWVGMRMIGGLILGWNWIAQPAGGPAPKMTESKTTRGR